MFRPGAEGFYDVSKSNLCCVVDLIFVLDVSTVLIGGIINILHCKHSEYSGIEEWEVSI